MVKGPKIAYKRTPTLQAEDMRSKSHLTRESFEHSAHLVKYVFTQYQPVGRRTITFTEEPEPT
jgi:hypothetical protein